MYKVQKRRYVHERAEVGLCTLWLYEVESNQACACYYPGVSISPPDKSLYLHAPHKTLNLISSSPELSCKQIF